MQNDHLFFPHRVGDDLEDRYEELLFEDKQFFTTRAIVPKVFRARLEKIRKREEAFRRISGIHSEEKRISTTVLNENSSDLLLNFLNFQKDRASILQYVYQVRECGTLIYLFYVSNSVWIQSAQRSISP